MIIFLGAGASSPFEIPVTRDFAIEIVETINRDNTVIVNNKNFLNELKDFFADRFDLEVLLTVLDDLSRENLLEIISPVTTQFLFANRDLMKYTEDPKFRESVNSLFTHAVDLIRKKILLKTREQKEVILQAYDKLFGVLSEVSGSSRTSAGGRYSYPGELGWVFTTNYDQCIETYLNERRIDFEDGINRKFGVNLFEINLINSPRRTPVVVKLHGSVDFFKTSDGKIVSLQFRLDSRQEIEQSVFPLGTRIEDEVLVHPTEAGTNRKIVESPFSDLYYQFRRSFQEDPNMIVIGFSFRDRTISSILENVIASSTGKNPRIYLIDPQARQIKETLKMKGYGSLSSIIIPMNTKLENPSIGEGIKLKYKKS